jgi:hypothetical protein
MPLLREAVGHHLLAVDEASGGYVFRHALVQEAVYGELLPAQRGLLHAAYARALGRRIGRRDADTGTSACVIAVELGRLAYHWRAADDPAQALPAFVRAGQAAELAAAPAEALQHYQRALELWDEVPGAAASSPLDRVAVLNRAAEAADLAGRDRAGGGHGARRAAGMGTGTRAGGSRPRAHAGGAPVAGDGPALGNPWPSAYARWRQAEALLAARAPRGAARASLAQAWALASTHGAAPLVTEIQALARRARIELPPPGLPTGHAVVSWRAGA